MPSLSSQSTIYYSALTGAIPLRKWVQLVLLIFLCMLARIEQAFPEEVKKAGLAQAIIGGTQVAQGAQPWMVALIRNSTSNTVPVRRLQFCGGVLISSDWILTAAHCVLRRSTSNISAIIGSQNIEHPSAERSALSEIVVHPNYNSRTFENDIALLKLATGSLSEPISILEDTAGSALAEQVATAYGWGQTYISNDKCDPEFADAQIDPNDFRCTIRDFNPASREFQEKLLRTNITILSENDCNARITDLINSLREESDALEEGNDFTVAQQICAYAPSQEKGVCFGDSGGALTVQHEGKEVLVGTASLVYGTGGCAREFATDIFTLSAPYTQFIDDVMHRDFSLNFENFCPPTMSLTVEYEPGEGVNTLTRLSWPTYEQALGYTLKYSSISAQNSDISIVKLDASLAEISEQLEPGLEFYVTLQAENEFCTSPYPEVLRIKVPSL